MKIRHQNKIYTIEPVCIGCKIFNPRADEAYFCCVATLKDNIIEGCPVDPRTFPLPENVRTHILYHHGRNILNENLFDGNGSPQALFKVLEEALRRMVADWPKD